MSNIKTLKDFLNMSNESSDEVFEKFGEIPSAIFRGESKERFLYVRGSRENRVLLVAHADTVWDRVYKRLVSGPKVLVQENGSIFNANGGLGADDRAGCAIVWLLYKELGHSVLIVDGEESGRHGSHWMINNNQDIVYEITKDHQFIIEFDRCNGKDFKCYNIPVADGFRGYIESVTAYEEPNRDSITDIVTLCDKDNGIDLSGVNLSTGFHYEHSDDEYLDIQEWQNTLDICRKWLSEKHLPRYELKKEV